MDKKDFEQLENMDGFKRRIMNMVSEEQRKAQAQEDRRKFIEKKMKVKQTRRK